MNAASDVRFVRAAEIVNRPAKGNRPASRGILSISASAWWAGVRSGIYPPGIKLSPRVTVWRLADVEAVADQASGGVR